MEPSETQLALDRDAFMRTLISHLADTLEDVVGLPQAAGFISLVGQKMGNELNDGYRAALQADRLSQEQLAKVLVDLKQRIMGDFFVIEQDETKIVFGNRTCPFGDRVIGRPAMCMMTSNVFGVIAAENLGYGRIELEETIAMGSVGCKVNLYLDSTDEPLAANSREYFQS